MTERTSNTVCVSLPFYPFADVYVCEYESERLFVFCEFKDLNEDNYE